MPESFFPAYSFSDDANVDSIWQELYSYKLRVAGELPLRHSPSQAEEQYRLFTSEGFSGIVLIHRVGKLNQLVVKQLCLEQGGTIEEAIWSVTERQRELTSREWNRFQTLLKKANVWEMAPWEDCMGLDGFRCVIETCDAHRYHSVARWCPERDDFGKLCDYFVSLYESLVGPPRPWWRLHGRRLTRR